jgi:hypothetical protein
MAFKMKGFPMQQGTSGFKKETLAAAGGGTEERKGGEREQDTTPTRGDLSKMPFGSAARIAEYKRRGWAMDETTRPKPEETKKPEVKKEEKKKEKNVQEKVDTSGGSKIDKIAEGKKPEGAKKASGRMKPGDGGYSKLPESEKLKIQKAAKAKHKTALDAWRKGGKKGKRPQRKSYF